MNNKKSGNDFEQEFAQTLAQNGYWVHGIASKRNGQPADMIAVKNGRPYLIDCKVCKSDVFPLNRIELNQHLAAERWRDCGNGEYWFSLKTSEGVFVVPYRNLIQFGRTGKTSVNLKQIRILGCRLEVWI